MPQSSLNNKLFVILRIVIGAILLVSGFEKALSPYQNFLYVIQSYQLLPSWGQEIVARAFPWIELITGLFLVVGLYTRYAIKAAFTLFAVFIAVIAQGLIRGLDLGDCGCFGSLLSLPPYVTIMMDSTIFILLSLLSRNIEQTNILSVDRMFEKKS